MKIFISCKEASRIISDGLDSTLPFSRRFLLRLHLAMCKTCGYFKRRTLALRKLLRLRARQEETPFPQDEPSLSEESRARIKALLKEKER